MAETTPNHTQTVSGCGEIKQKVRHEITGIITKVGSNVKEFEVGDRDGAGVGFMACSCLKCGQCESHQENYCDELQATYNGIFWDGSITYGGYSKMIRFVVKIPENLPMSSAAPLLCTGITVFSPMKDNNMLHSPGKKLGIVGLGGLGHIAVKLAKAFGLHVTVISTSPSKEKEAKERLGADSFVLSTDAEQMERAVKGTIIEGMKETREMMDLCGKHNITCDVEVIKPHEINEAMTRLVNNDVRYRFVINISDNLSSAS
ncbi:hypothetical protein Scep_000273 [Stephania cephalantha]|uniref:Uncharacterized protein n=1 Tax=Stephania cephalantha TaxID=152367 RepID=A0AAP0Q2A1_9MAGN